MIKVYNIEKEYLTANKITVKAVRDVTLSFPKSGLIAITGKSGCGKTTLLNLLGGLDKTDSGKIVYDMPEKTYDFSKMTSSELDEFINLNVGFVFQNYYLIDNWTVEDNIRLVLEQQDTGFSCNEKNIELIKETLEYVGLPGYEKRYANELSGGEQQRVAFARALIKRPCVILADEPTGNLDSESSDIILSLLKKYSEHCLIIMVTHDQDAANKYADRIIKLSDGSIVDDLNVSNDSKKLSDTETDYTKQHTAKAAKRLSTGTVLKLSLNQLLIKRVKLVLMSLVMIILLSVIFVSSSLIKINYGKSIQKAINEEEITILHPYKVYCYTDRDGYPDKVTIHNSSEIRSECEQLFGKEHIKNVINNVIVADLYGNRNDVVNLVLGGAVPEKIKLEGRLPQNNHEIVLNDLTISALGFDDFTSGLQVSLMGRVLDVCGIMKYNAENVTSAEWYSNEGILLARHGNRALVSEDFYQLLLDSDQIFLSLADVGYNKMIVSAINEKTAIMPLSALKNDLIWGELPKNNYEIVVSEGYALRNSLDEDYHQGTFWNIYEEETMGAFTGYLNLANFLEDVTICGCAPGYDNSKEAIIYISDVIFERIKQHYSNVFFADAIEICLTDTKTSKVYNTLIDNNIGLYNEEYSKVIELKNDFGIYLTLLKLMFYLASTLLMLVMLLFISFNVKDNRKTIGILKALGCSGKDVFRVWNCESIIICGVTGFLTGVVGLLALNYIEHRAMRSVGLESGLIIANPILFLAILIVYFLICLLMVAIPLWEMGEKKPIELIKSRT